MQTLPQFAMALEITLIGTGVVAAVLVRPWRILSAGVVPWTWVAVTAAVPVCWSLDLASGAALVQPLSLAPLLVLFFGWPLTVLALIPIAAFTAVAHGLGAAEALHRLFWLGMCPATLALLAGAGTRRWLPHHLFVYILARAWLGSFLACVLPNLAGVWIRPLSSSLTVGDQLLAGTLSAYGEASVSAGLIAALVAFRPLLLATYSDRLYLPRPPPR